MKRVGALTVLCIVLSLILVQPALAEIEFFTATPSSPVTVGTWVDLHGKGDRGTCRFTINGEPRAEFAGAECTETWKTEEFGAGTYQICFELRQQGGWTNAERECKRYRVTGSTSSGSGGSSGNSSGSTSNSNECYNAPSINIRVGELAYVADVDGTGNRLRESPSTSASIITVVPVYGGFEVVGGPECSGGYRWWRVRTPGDSVGAWITGWMADGSGSERWIELGMVGMCMDGCGDDNSNVVPPSTSGMEFDWYYEPFDHFYHIEFDPTSCLITNGSEVVASEIERFSFWVSEIRGQREKDLAVVPYFATRIGDIDSFRRFLTLNLSDASAGNCYASTDGNTTDIRYQVGTHYMDMSGLGNIVFGLYMERYNRRIEEFIADMSQGANPDSLFQLSDNPDDVSQRDTGRSIAESIGRSASPTTTTVERAADENNLR